MLQVRSAPILGLGVTGWVTGLLFAVVLCALVFRKRGSGWVRPIG